jgi:hypothetical protein
MEVEAKSEMEATMDVEAAMDVETAIEVGAMQWEAETIPRTVAWVVMVEVMPTANDFGMGSDVGMEVFVIPDMVTLAATAAWPTVGDAKEESQWNRH